MIRYRQEKMKSSIVISIILIFVTCIHGQRVDTLNFSNHQIIITDCKLYEKDRCTKVDTSVAFHACNNYHGEDIILTFYDFDVQLCDSLKLLSDSKNKRLLISNEKRKIQDSNRRNIRLIPDTYNHNKIYYSPEVLFEVQVGKTNYEFKSIDQIYNLSFDELNLRFFIKERIPNAFSHFGEEKILVSLTTEEDSNWIKSQNNYLYYIDGQYNMRYKPKFINITILNKCGDRLTMQFNII